mgnify:CR=1 FL=1
MHTIRVQRGLTYTLVSKYIHLCRCEVCSFFTVCMPCVIIVFAQFFETVVLRNQRPPLPPSMPEDYK